MSDFAIMSPRGVIVRTASHEDLARKWLFERRQEFPGFIVVEIRTETVQATVYKPRLMA